MEKTKALRAIPEASLVREVNPGEHALESRIALLERHAGPVERQVYRRKARFHRRPSRLGRHRDVERGGFRVVQTLQEEQDGDRQPMLPAWTERVPEEFVCLQQAAHDLFLRKPTFSRSAPQAELGRRCPLCTHVNKRRSLRGAVLEQTRDEEGLVTPPNVKTERAAQLFQLIDAQSAQQLVELQPWRREHRVDDRVLLPPVGQVDPEAIGQGSELGPGQQQQDVAGRRHGCANDTRAYRRSRACLLPPPLP
ncbi:hypothetical protein [Sorangium sp. So ce1153]|uniref:hypothetical protein n=1 Tax=Sorangium sp. So ce1153 TaxID=3133333 RepID=UPI003F60DE8A